MLKRITTEFSDVEDRIRLGGRDDDNETITLWLTQRLLARLLPPLIKWLEGKEAGAHAGAADPSRLEAVQQFAQQNAGTARQTSPPVRPEASTPEYLVHEVDIQKGDRHIKLVFKSPAVSDSPPALVLDIPQLRQWLGILYRHYRTADWPMSPWPTWMTAAPPDQSDDDVVMH